jgi:hypothetical protein
MDNEKSAAVFQPVEVLPGELSCPSLKPSEVAALHSALNFVGAGRGTVTVIATYSKQRHTAPRLAEQDYVALPGVGPEVQHGDIVSVFRLADNRANRKAGTVGAIRFRIASYTRRNGSTEELGYTTVIPSGLTSLAVTAVRQSVASDSSSSSTGAA